MDGSKKAAKMFLALTGDKRFETVYNNLDKMKKKGGIAMCDIVQSFVDKGIEKGIEKGRSEERAEIIRIKYTPNGRHI